MATVKPFRGIFYNPRRISNPAAVTAPPYDVISPEQQSALYNEHPHNVIRLILGQARQTDSEHDNPHTRSAAYFRAWIAQGILKADNTPALYLTATTYTHAQRTLTRHGLIARVGLEGFDKRVVRPHEQTFSQVRSERLALMKATHCNYCPIFSLYNDDDGLLAGLQAVADPSAAAIDFLDQHGHRYQLWRILDPAVQRRVADSLKTKPLYIADGHHRYETALNFRRHLQALDPAFNERHPANDVLMYLCAADDPGLIILPSHRLVKTVDAADLQPALEKSRAWFDVLAYPFAAGDRRRVQERFLADLHRESGRTCFGMYAHRSPVFHRLTVKPGVMDQCFGKALDPALRALDVTVLTRLMFTQILGFDPARMDNPDFIEYVSSAAGALQAVDSGDCDAAFILNPTRIEQVRKIADQGLFMPRKSTYFYPKVKSGLVLRSLGNAPDRA